MNVGGQMSVRIYTSTSLPSASICVGNLADGALGLPAKILEEAILLHIIMWLHGKYDTLTRMYICSIATSLTDIIYTWRELNACVDWFTAWPGCVFLWIWPTCAVTDPFMGTDAGVSTWLGYKRWLAESCQPSMMVRLHSAVCIWTD